MKTFFSIFLLVGLFALTVYEIYVLVKKLLSRRKALKNKKREVYGEHDGTTDANH